MYRWEVLDLAELDVLRRPGEQYRVTDPSEDFLPASEYERIGADDRDRHIDVGQRQGVERRWYVDRSQDTLTNGQAGDGGS